MNRKSECLAPKKKSVYSKSFVQKALFKKAPLCGNKVDLLSASHSQENSGLLTSSPAISRECSSFRGSAAWGLEVGDPHQQRLS